MFIFFKTISSSYYNKLQLLLGLCLQISAQVLHCKGTFISSKSLFPFNSCKLLQSGVSNLARKREAPTNDLLWQRHVTRLKILLSDLSNHFLEDILFLPVGRILSALSFVFTHRGCGTNNIPLYYKILSM